MLLTTQTMLMGTTMGMDIRMILMVNKDMGSIRTMGIIKKYMGIILGIMDTMKI